MAPEPEPDPQDAQDEGGDYAFRLASILILLRSLSGKTQAELEEAMGVPAGKLGRWERGNYPPKAHELGKIYSAYERWGAEMEWLIWPPDANDFTKVRAKLNALARSGAIAADAAEQRAQLRRLRAASLPSAARGRRSA